ncbi:ankycorbin isoform X4 [Engraulis encrasicolus]|uniref:ankycorbin isoform X4 n=1 Tax=Engraulis encrasicolus TaxID=184585 RepID=UPI002FD0758E
MKSLKAKFRKTDAHEWSKNDERLLSAVEHGEPDKVASLLAKKGASAVKLDAEGKSALHVAAMKGQAECLAVILAHGADVAVIDASGSTALHLAAKNNHQDCAKKLIQSKSALDACDGSGKTALHQAAMCGNTAIVQLLCEHRSPVNIQDAEGSTPLLLSARHAHVDVCRSLVQWGADVNARDKNGRTAVMLATESSCVGAVQMLLQQRGINLRLADSLGHDVLHYAKLSGSQELRTILNAALQRQQADTDKKTPQKTPQEEELQSMVLKEEVEKLLEEKSMLLETIEDLKQIAEQTHAEPQALVGGLRGGSADAALVSTLQAKVAALSLENQQLSQIIKKRPTPQGEDEDSRPNSIDSNASYHSTRADFEHPSLSEVEMAAMSAIEEELRRGGGGGGGGSSQEEVLLLQKTLHSVQCKVLDNQPYAKLTSGSLDEKGMLESVADLQAKLAVAQDKYLRAAQEVQALRAEASQSGGGGAGGPGGRRASEVDDGVLQKVQKLKNGLEQEVKELRAKLGVAEEMGRRDAQRIRDMEARLEVAANQESHARQNQGSVLETLKQEKTQLMKKYKEAQEEARLLQEALKGTVPVEAAAKDFEAMKSEMNEVIEGLQRRLRELSKSYSETKSELNAARNQLNQSPVPSLSFSEKDFQEQAEELQAATRKAEESETKHGEALKEVSRLQQELEVLTQTTVSLADHTQVVASMGTAIKELEGQTTALKTQLSQKALQVDALQNRLTVEQERTPDDSVPRQEHVQLREKKEAEVAQVTRLLQDALRKQDELALEVAAAWQEVKDGRGEKQAAEELAASRLQENNTLSAKHREAQDLTNHLKKQVENHVASEREKNKKIDDLSKEVAKLKEALNSLSQLSYSGSGAPKRQQQNQQLEALQAQVKQLQYQLTESKKQHHEIVSVYRMHLLYAVQGQMDEDVQKALKQILMMCKMSTEAQ